MELGLFLSNFKLVSDEYQKELMGIFERDPKNLENLLAWMEENINDFTLEAGDELRTAFYLLAYLKEPRGFALVRKLMDLDIEEIDFYFGGSFSALDAPRLMACFLEQGEQLYEVIENSSIEQDWKIAALEALTYLVGKGSLMRASVIHYLKKLLRQILESPSPDPGFTAYVIETCCRLHPSEVAEEIREAFAKDIVDILISDIANFNADLIIPLPEALEFLQKDTLEELNPLEALRGYFRETEEDLELVQDDELEEIDEPVVAIGRNDPCLCGSGKKYKKCCLFVESESHQKIRCLTMEITSDPIEDELYPCTLHPEDKKLIEGIYFEMQNTPEKALELLLPLKEKYPQHPALYNFIYSSYQFTGKQKEAMEILEETRQLFPRYLFGLLEYGQYLIKREEYDQFPLLFNHCFTLNDLYPERKTFHISEVKFFTFVMGKYFAAIGNTKQAKIYLDCLQQFFPDEDATIHLENLVLYPT